MSRRRMLTPEEATRIMTVLFRVYALLLIIVGGIAVCGNQHDASEATLAGAIFGIVLLVGDPSLLPEISLSILVAVSAWFVGYAIIRLRRGGTTTGSDKWYLGVSTLAFAPSCLGVLMVLEEWVLPKSLGGF